MPQHRPCASRLGQAEPACRLPASLDREGSSAPTERRSAAPSDCRACAGREAETHDRAMVGRSLNGNAMRSPWVGPWACPAIPFVPLRAVALLVCACDTHFNGTREANSHGLPYLSYLAERDGGLNASPYAETLVSHPPPASWKCFAWLIGARTPPRPAPPAHLQRGQTRDGPLFASRTLEAADLHVSQARVESTTANGDVPTT